MINVTKPFLPPFEEYSNYLKGIWDRQWLTNNGPLVNELEEKLKNYLGVKHLFFVGNGTIALQIAIKALKLKGEIITTPFSFVATTSSIVWENCTPVFVDIDPNTLNLDPHLIEKAITKDTQAILATHVFGNPCDIMAIEKIAAKHDLKVIYDGAHAFGTTYNQKSILNSGDISTLSFHATKLFHTIEGGAIMTNDTKLAFEMDMMRNFGFNGPENFECVGINGKNSEFHAGMGLCNLKYIDEILTKRKILTDYYNENIGKIPVTKQSIHRETQYNNAYYPIIFESTEALIRAVNALNENKISPRRYFYPSLSSLNYVKKYTVPISDAISSRILCLPLYHTLTFQEIDLIIRVIAKSLI